MSSASQAALVSSTSSQASSPPPIRALLPLVTYALSAAASATSFISHTLVSTILLILTPFSVVIPALSYAFAPVIISVHLLLEVFILTPYRVTIYVLQALYPIYAFVGVAVVFGAVLGLAARHVVRIVGKGLLGGPRRSVAIRKRQNSRAPSVQRRSTVKGKKKVTVKQENVG